MRKLVIRIFNQISQLCGMLAVFFQLSTFLYISAHTSFNWLGTKPISDLGVSRLYHLWMIGCLAGGISLCVYLINLIKTYHPNKWFIVAFTFGIICELAIAIFPDKSVNQAHVLNQFTYIHEYGATLLLFALPAIMFSFQYSASATLRLKKFTKTSVLIYIVLLVPVAVLIKRSIAYPIDELVPLLIFDLWVSYESLSDYALPTLEPVEFTKDAADLTMR